MVVSRDAKGTPQLLLAAYDPHCRPRRGDQLAGAAFEALTLADRAYPTPRLSLPPFAFGLISWDRNYYRGSSVLTYAE
jgi:hypothetical protein